MHVDEKASNTSVAPTQPISEPLTPLPPEKQPPAIEDDSPDAIFFRAVSEIPTQPLNRLFTPQWELDKKIARECAFTLFLFLFSLIATVIVRIIFQPVVTVTLLPVHSSVQMTATLKVETRTLAPVTITRTLTAPTTGHGRQDATRATGTLTFYNGLFTQQTIPTGTVFSGSNDIHIVTDEPVTIPAANPPQFAEATVTAHVFEKGAAGNIQAGEISTTVANGVLVKNLAAFTGGRDARDYKAVAKHDLDTLTAQLQQQLDQAMPQAFTLRSGEALQTTHCTTHITPDHGIGEEAQAVTVNTSKTCGAIAYNQDELTKKAAIVFNATRSGTKYELAGTVRTTVMSISPLTVRLSGQWEYAFSQDYEQYLAQQIQGDTPAEARAYLFKTGLVSRVTITPTQSLPDYYHIKFLILIGV